MAAKRIPPGSKKGVPKPAKRKLDAHFHERLKAAMAARQWGVPQLAKEAGCTRAVILNYLAGGKAQIDALLLFDIADKLKVSERWLARNEGTMPPRVALDPEQHRALNAFALLNKTNRDVWFKQSEALREGQEVHEPTEAAPFPAGSPKTRVKAPA